MVNIYLNLSLSLGAIKCQTKSDRISKQYANKNLIMLGTVVDVGKLLSQLERSEQARFDAESRLSATHKILTNIREAEGKQTAIKEKLQVTRGL